MASPHITFVLPGFGGSGGFRTLTEWANRLTGDGVQVTVVSPANGESRRWLSPSVQVRRAKPQRLWDVAHAQLGRVIGRREAFTLNPLLCAPLIPRDSQVVNCFAPFDERLFCHTPALTYLQHWEPVWFEDDARAATVAERRTRAVSAGITNSTWLREHYPPERRDALPLVFPGVDAVTFRPGLGSHRTTSPRPLRLVALGREVPFKGLADLRAAARRLTRPVELILFGTNERKRLDGPVPEEHVGQLAPPDLADLYRSADVVVTPSWYESFPLPPLEAMACGATVVTSRQGTEDYAVDGQNAYVFTGGDVDGLVDALERAVQARPGHFATAARATAEHFTWESGYRMLRDALTQHGVLS